MHFNHLQNRALLLESAKEMENLPAQSHILEPFPTFSIMQALKMFIHLLSVQGENNKCCMAPLQRQKCHVFEECCHCGAPRIHSRPPSRTSKVTLRREKMPACLFEALLLHIYDWIWGKTQSSNTTKNKTQSASFLDVGACLMLAGLHGHGKKITGTLTCYLWWCRELAPYSWALMFQSK